MTAPLGSSDHNIIKRIPRAVANSFVRSYMSEQEFARHMSERKFARRNINTWVRSTRFVAQVRTGVR